MTNFQVRSLPAQPITSANFRPFGQVIFPTADGKPFDQEDAQLQLGATPRFYIMQLHHRGRSFTQITRHQRCTQCLGALASQNWLIAVAPPQPGDCPNLESIAAFQIPGNCFIKLAAGTWHAGPYFDANTVDFYNLELSDTNTADHQTCDLQLTYQIRCHII